MRLITFVTETTYKNMTARLENDIDATYDAQDAYDMAVNTDAAGSTPDTQAAVAAALAFLTACQTVQAGHQTALWKFMSTFQNATS